MLKLDWESCRAVQYGFGMARYVLPRRGDRLRKRCR